MLFKNVQFFQATADLKFFLSGLNQRLFEWCSVPLHSMESYRTGWTHPFEGAQGLFYCANNVLFLRLEVAEKKIPAKVLNQALKERVADIESRDNKKVGRKEKLSLKEELIAEMIPKTPVQRDYVSGYVDLSRGVIGVGTQKPSAAELWLDTLRQTMGSLPVVPLDVKANISGRMYSWLKDESVPAQIDSDITSGRLRSDLTEGRCADFKSVDLVGNVCLSDFSDVEYLGVDFDGRLEFRLCNDLAVKSIKYCDDLLEEAGESYGSELPADRFDVDLFLMVVEFRKLLDFFGKEFEYRNPFISGTAFGSEGDQPADMFDRIRLCHTGRIAPGYVGDLPVESDGVSFDDQVAVDRLAGHIEKLEGCRIEVPAQAGEVVGDE